MDTPFVRCAKEVTYQRRPASLLATCRRDNLVSTIPEVFFSCLDEDWNLLCLVIKRRYWAREHHFETRLRSRHNLLVGSHNVEIFSIIPADRGGLYSVLSDWWGEYECLYLSFVPTPLVLSYYGGLYLRGDPDDVRQIVTLATSELAILAGVQFLLYAATGAAPEYFVGSLRLEHVGGGMLFRLPTPICNNLSHFGFYRVAERMLMDSVLVGPPFYRVTEADWPLSGGSDDFIPYDFATGTVQGYRAEEIAPVKRQKVDDGPVVSVMAPSVDLNWLPGLSRKTFSEVERDYRRYRGMLDDDSSRPTDVPADVVDDLDDVFAQEALWEGDGGSSFTADDRFVIATALARLSKTVLGLGSDFANLVKGLPDDLETSQAANAVIEEEVERQEVLDLEAEGVKRSVPSDVTSFRERVAAAGTRDAELLFNASAVSDQMARATAELQEALDTISTQSKELAMVAQLKSCIKSPEDNVALYEASEDELKRKLAVAINDSTRLSQLVDDIRVEVVDLRERLGARHGVIQSIVKHSCTSLGPSLRGLVHGFRAGLNRSVAEAFRTGSIGSQLHADVAKDCITLCFSGGAASDDGYGSTKGRVVRDPSADPEVIQL